MTEERLAELMVKTVDGVASPAEREELMAHITTDPVLYREFEMQSALKTTTDDWVQRLTLDAALDAHDAQHLSKIEYGVGITLVIFGVSMLLAGGIYTAAITPDAPLFVRLGVPLLSAGALIVLASTLRWKLTTGKTDKYTEINR